MGSIGCLDFGRCYLNSECYLSQQILTYVCVWQSDVLKATLATDAVIGAMVRHPTYVNPFKLTFYRDTVVTLNDLLFGRPVFTRLAVDTCCCIT